MNKTFHYIVLNQAGKELSGVIEALDDSAARENLNRLGLSVISLKEIQTGRQIKSTEVTAIYEFEANDKKGKKVVGTITAETPLKAFARLFDEYQLSITYLVEENAAPEEKEKTRKTGIGQLQKEYEKLYVKRDEDTKTQKLITEEDLKRKELLEKVEFTIRRIGDFLKKFSQELKIEERDTIQGYVNQLIRIKDSTNLDHIRTTCEKMLTHIQEKELFINEEQKIQESAKVKVETKELLDQLKRTGLKQEIDIVKIVESWQNYPFLKKISNFILRLLSAKNPQIRQLRDEIKIINRYIWSYIKMLIFGKSKVVRLEALGSIKTLREEKKRLKMQLYSLKLAEKNARGETTTESYFWDQLAGIIGWVLAFYLISYIGTYLFTIKNFNIGPIPKSFYFYQSKLTSAVTLFFFLTYCAIGVRNFWLRKNLGLTYFLYPLTLFGFLLIVINLM